MVTVMATTMVVIATMALAVVVVLLEVLLEVEAVEVQVQVKVKVASTPGADRLLFRARTTWLALRLWLMGSKAVVCEGGCICRCRCRCSLWDLFLMFRFVSFVSLHFVVSWLCFGGISIRAGIHIYMHTYIHTYMHICIHTQMHTDGQTG